MKVECKLTIGQANYSATCVQICSVNLCKTTIPPKGSESQCKQSVFQLIKGSHLSVCLGVCESVFFSFRVQTWVASKATSEDISECCSECISANGRTLWGIRFYSLILSSFCLMHFKTHVLCCCCSSASRASRCSKPIQRKNRVK